MRLRKQFLCLLLAALLLALTVPAGVFVTRAAQTGEVTRAQWIEALVDTFAMTVDEDNYPDNYYSDISEKDSFYRDIMVAVEFGVIDLEAGLAFEPNAPATREFAAHTLNFCLGYQLDADAAYSFSEAQTVTYPNDIQVALNRGWFALSGNSFKPENPITAAEKQKMLNDAKAVLAADQLAEDYTNSYQFADGVKVLPENTVFTQESETVYIISSPAKSIAKGDLFVLFDDDVPVVCKAEAVSVSQGDYTVTVSRQNINDYLLSMDAQGSTTGDLKEFQVADDVDALYVLEDGTRVKDVKASGTKKIKAIYFSGQISNLSVAIELYDMKLDWQAKGNVLNPSSIKVKAIVTGKTFCNASLAFGASVSDYTGPLTLGYCPIGSLGSVTVTANISVDGCITVSYGANFKTGVEYTYSDGFRIPQSFQKTHFSLTVEATLDMSVTARASITNIPLLSAQCYATVGMKANFVARYRGADKDPALCLHTDTWLYAKIGASATVGFSSEKFQKSWRTDLTIWDRNTSPARSVSHFEDGTRVSSCAYGETNFFGYNSYYWSSLASRYANGGVSAVANVPTYTYTTDENGNATITGYSGGFAALSLPATIDGHKVVAIGENAFKNRDELISVSLPATVTKVGVAAFCECDNLREINLPKGILTIDNYAFSGDKSLIRVTLPEGLQVLGCGAFKDCTGLQRVHIPKDMNTGTHCGSNYMYPAPFSNCTALSQVTFGEGITSLPNALFGDCYGLTSIVIPDTVHTLNWKTFQSCKNLQSVTLSVALTEIGGSCFHNCTSLKEIKLPGSLQVLGCGAFESCTALETVNIPKTMRTASYCGSNYMYPGPFKNCSALKNITIEEGIKILPEGLFSECTGPEEIVVPEGVTEIQFACFRGCSVKKITLPKTLKTLSSRVFHMSGLESVTLPDSITSIGDHILADCPSLKSANWPAGTTYMPDYAFAGSAALETVTLPDTLTTIHRGIFRSCKALVMTTLPESVTQIGEELFYDCDALTSFTIPGKLTNLNHNFFNECDGLKEITIPANIITMGNGIFYDCDALTKVTMANTVKTMGSGIFRGCEALKDVTLSQNLRGIPGDAFRECASLEQIVIPHLVTSIGGNAFNASPKLTKVVTGPNLKSIDSNAFSYASTTVLYGAADSYTQTWAGENGYQFKVNDTSATSVTLPETTVQLKNGSTLQLCPAIAPLDFGDKVVFKSNKTDVVTVSDTGELKAVNVGTATIKITAGNVSASCTVTVVQPVTWVGLNKMGVSLEVPATYQLIATVRPDNASDNRVVWTSSDESVAKVDQNGLVTAVGNGLAVITATAQDGSGKSASCNVGVVDPNNIPVEKLSIVYRGGDLAALETVQLTAGIFPGDAANKKVLWTSSDETVATVDENGVLTGLKKGEVTITATAADGYGATATLALKVAGTGYVVTDPAQLESPHNYPVSCTDGWKYTVPGSVALEVTT